MLLLECGYREERRAVHQMLNPAYRVFLAWLLLTPLRGQGSECVDGTPIIWDGTGRTFALDAKRWSLRVVLPERKDPGPRPRLRQGRTWISNGKKILVKGQGPAMWMPLPPEISAFEDFEILPDGNLILLGPQWGGEIKDPGKLAAIAVVVDAQAAKVLSVLFSAPGQKPPTSFYEAAALGSVEAFWVEDLLVIYGRFSGHVYVYDSTLKRMKTHALLPETAWAKPERLVNRGRNLEAPILLPNFRLLFALRRWEAGPDGVDHPLLRWVELDLISGDSHELEAYEGIQPSMDHTWVCTAQGHLKKRPALP